MTPPLSLPPRCAGILAALTLCIGLLSCTQTGPEDGVDSGDVGTTEEEAPPRPSGLTVNEAGVSAGYVLYSPLSSGVTYLLDNQGEPVHTWESPYAPHSLYLLEDGSLLRPGRDPEARKFTVGGSMGILQKYTWDGELIWEWKFSDDSHILHHDVEPLPNGNLLAIGWEVKTPDEAREVGRRDDLIPEEGLWPDIVLEIEPLPPSEARIVWIWRIWDHLVQNHDPDAPSYGDPADHPHRLDINAGGVPTEIDPEELEQLRALGYVPDAPEDETGESTDATGEEEEEEEMRSDFLHINAVDWNPELDQIALTVPDLGEIWVIRRPSSTEEAAGPAGDLVYRWGNPATYGRGDESDKRLFYPHDVQWIPAGYPNAGQLTVFNNGNGRPEGEWSSVEQIEPPLQPDHSYALADGQAWGPSEVTWSWAAEERESLYAPFISGAHRLPGGNTFITSGPEGRFLEVDLSGRVVWEFWNPHAGEIRESDGTRPWGAGERLLYGVWRAQKLPPGHPGLARLTE